MQGSTPIGSADRLGFEWDGSTVRLACKTIREDLYRRASASSPAIYYLSVEFADVDEMYFRMLKSFIAEHVTRALDEQKANARGVPAVAASSVQRGSKVRGYLRFQFGQGGWTKTETQSVDQPKDGFTVSLEEEPSQLEMLCQTYEMSDFDGRKMIRQMAELSVSTADGVPTRRYQP